MTETWRDFTRKVFAWLDQVDPDGPEPSVEKRDAKLTRDLDGTARLTASLTRVGAEIAPSSGDVADQGRHDPRTVGSPTPIPRDLEPLRARRSMRHPPSC